MAGSGSRRAGRWCRVRRRRLSDLACSDAALRARTGTRRSSPAYPRSASLAMHAVRCLAVTAPLVPDGGRARAQGGVAWPRPVAQGRDVPTPNPPQLFAPPSSPARRMVCAQAKVGEVHLHVLAYSAAGCRRPRGPCRQRPFDTFMAALSGGHLACSSARLEIGGLAPPHDGSWSRPS